MYVSSGKGRGGGNVCSRRQSPNMVAVSLVIRETASVIFNHRIAIIRRGGPLSPSSNHVRLIPIARSVSVPGKCRWYFKGLTAFDRRLRETGTSALKAITPGANPARGFSHARRCTVRHSTFDLANIRDCSVRRKRIVSRENGHAERATASFALTGEIEHVSRYSSSHYVIARTKTTPPIAR